MDQLTTEDRAAIRAYLQRSEVRLSTLHRTATALLSGAGVLVLLPALGRDAFVNVARRLLIGERDLPDLFVMASVALVMFSILVVLWLLLVELTRFYFHANHFADDEGTTFTPRFALAGSRLPVDELSALGRSGLHEQRIADQNLEQLFAPNSRTREQIDRKVSAYPGLPAPVDDASRAEALLLLAGVRDRSLLGDVAKTEYALSRHVLRIQVIVLRYIKALLTVILSLLLAFALTASADGASEFGNGALEVAVILLLVWASSVLFSVSSPIRWLTAILRSEGATRSGIRYDREMVRLERIVSVITTAVSVLAAAAGVLLLTTGDATGIDTPFLVGLVVGVAAHGVLLRKARTV